MKTLKSLTLGLCLLAAGVVAKANIKNDDKAASPYSTINTYVDAMTRGKVDGFDQVIDKSAKFNLLRGKNIVSFDKTQMVDFMKQSENVEQPCTVSTSVVNSDSDITVMKVDMKYDDFVRTNYVTLSHAGNTWKITNVYSVFK